MSMVLVFNVLVTNGRMRISTHVSDWKRVNGGVAQGTVLEPPFYIQFTENSQLYFYVAMKLNISKCKELIIHFSKHKSFFPTFKGS
jgi:hypothetical protein